VVRYTGGPGLYVAVVESALTSHCPHEPALERPSKPRPPASDRSASTAAADRPPAEVALTSLESTTRAPACASPSAASWQPDEGRDGRSSNGHPVLGATLAPLTMSSRRAISRNLLPNAPTVGAIDGPGIGHEDGSSRDDKVGNARPTNATRSLALNRRHITSRAACRWSPHPHWRRSALSQGINRFRPRPFARSEAAEEVDAAFLVRIWARSAARRRGGDLGRNGLPPATGVAVAASRRSAGSSTARSDCLVILTARLFVAASLLAPSERARRRGSRPGQVMSG